MRRTSSMRLHRKASLQLLNSALDISTKYTKWVAGVQPKVSDDDIREELKQRQLIEQVDKLQHCESLSGQIRVAVIGIAPVVDPVDGSLRESVQDLLHDDIVDSDYEHSPKVAIPEACWEVCTQNSLHLVVERAFKQSTLQNEPFHQIFCLSIGNVQFFIFNVQGRPANQKLVLHPSNGITWVGPLQLAGRGLPETDSEQVQ
eukprot:TRINITY_DN26353_c0_g1_i1.p1 TRINITY_DN26353_c0_g1~~TRINITY_DN26353_c0_g1_i1.p1  ORF type:complete len:228 (+),score=37.39 TRINITY_DN26353_c0_g1_i1:81-686(+)